MSRYALRFDSPSEPDAEPMFVWFDAEDGPQKVIGEDYPTGASPRLLDMALKHEDRVERVPFDDVPLLGGDGDA